MYFNPKSKITFGKEEEDPSILAEKIQAIAYVAWGCFEGDITDLNKNEKDLVVWRLSDFIKPKDQVKVKADKLFKAFKDKENK